MGMLAKVEGELYVRTDAKTINIEFYEEEFILDNTIKDIGEARSIIRKGLLNERLRKKVKNYKKFRTCQVVSLEKTNEESKTGEMEKKLLEATKLGCVPVNLDSYLSEGGKEKALEKAIEVKKQRAKADKKKQKRAKVDVEDLGIVD